MKIPKAVKLKNGDWRIRLRLGAREELIHEADKASVSARQRQSRPHGLLSGSNRSG